MEKFNQKRFLRCFDQLADLEEGRRNQAVNQLIADLALPSESTDATTGTTNRNKEHDSTSNKQIKNPLSSQRAYRFRYTVKEHNLLQYTLDRLIRGLKADRKASRTGFTVALSSVFDLYGDNIAWVQVARATLEYTSPKECISSELRDGICGRLYLLFTLQRAGFFLRQEAREELKGIYRSIWEIYDFRIYFQDAACMLLWLICRDIYRSTKDIDLTLKHVGSRLSKVLDPEFISSTVNCQQDKRKIMEEKNKDASTHMGKGLTGVLPTALFGLYLRLHEELGKENTELIKNTVIEKSAIDEENFSLALRYVSCIPGNHPVIGSFFDVLLDYILKSESAEERLKQLWNSINLSMLDLQGGCSAQRGFTGLRLASMILLKIQNSPTLLRVFCKGGKNFFITLCRYHKAPKGDVMKDISRNVLQLLVSVIQGVDTTQTNGMAYNTANPTTNDFLMYAKVNRVLSEPVDSAHSKNAKDIPSRKEQKIMNTEAMKQTVDRKNCTSEDSLTSARVLPGDCVVDCIVAIAESVNYAAESVTFLQNLFGSFVRASDDIPKLYTLLESQGSNLDVVNDSKKLYWILSLLQQCVSSANKEDRLELFERYFATNGFFIPVEVDGSTILGISICKFSHNSTTFRALLVNRPKQGAYAQDQEDVDMHDSAHRPEDKLWAISARMLNSCFSTLSKCLNGVPTKRKDLLKVGPGRLNELLSLTETINKLYEAMSYVSENRGNFIIDKSISSNSSELQVIVTNPGAKDVVEEPAHKRPKHEKKEWSMADLSKKLQKGCINIKQKNMEQEPLTAAIRVYGSTLALLLLLLESSENSRVLCFGGFDDKTKEHVSWIPENDMEQLRHFSEAFAEALQAEPLSSDRVMKIMMTDNLVDTVLSDDQSAAFGLLRSIAKGIWTISTPYITEDMRESLLQNGLLSKESYENSAYQVEESESDVDEGDSDSEDEDTEEDSKSDSKSDSTEEDEAEGRDGEDIDEDTADEEEEEDSEEEVDEEDNEEDSDASMDSSETSDTEQQKTGKEGEDEADDESDIELSGAEALEELLKDEEGGLESLRMERLKVRMMQDLSPEATKLRLRNLDMLDWSIEECSIDACYVNMVSRLYSGYQAAVSVQGTNLGGNVQALMAEYVKKLGRVLEESIKYVSRAANDKVKEEETTESSVSVKVKKVTEKVKFANPEEAMTILLHLSLQAINGQRSEKTAKTCRNQAVQVLEFALKVEQLITGAAPIQTKMVILASLLSALLCKTSRLGTNFFVQLARKCTNELSYVDWVNLAKESKVEFIQSELLTICTFVVEASKAENVQKPKRLCRRRSGKAIELIRAEDELLNKVLPNKEKVITYITDDVISSSLKALPSLLIQMKEKLQAMKASNEPKESGKSAMKPRGISPLLAKTAARLVSSLVKAADLTSPKNKEKLKEIKNAIEDIKADFSGSKAAAKQLQPLQAAIGSLSRALEG